MHHAVRSSVCLLAVLALVACASDATIPVEQEAPAFTTLPNGLQSTGDQLVVMEGQRLPPNFAQIIRNAGGTVVTPYNAIGVAVVRGLSDAAVEALVATDEVRAISPDYVLSLDPVGGEEVVDASSAEVASPSDPTTATRYPRQWHLRAIQADMAWAAGYLGSPGVTVAILDTGIDYTHPDLVGRVDLGRSRSFVPADDAVVAALFPGAHPIADLHFHGTHVGATVSSNALAAAGVTSMTTLVGVKVCNRFGSCPTSGVLAGVMYAADAGADVINMSLGGLFLKDSNPGLVAVINRSFNYANRKGAVVVVAAGNANFDLDHHIAPDGTQYPSLYASYCDQAITACVSATAPTAAAGVNGPWTNVDMRAPYSNYGRSAIDVAAPGGRSGLTGFGGLVWAACSRFSLQIPVCQTGTFILGINGTSMAAPHASGVAALLVGKLGKKQPGLVRQRLHQSADDLGEPGTDPFYGKGRVNAYRAIQ